MSTELASLPELSAALVAAQKIAGSVAKDAHNAHHRYDYADAESVIGQARAALNAHDLTVSPGGVEIVPGSPTYMIRGYVLRHASGEVYEARMLWPIVPGKGRPEDKAMGSAETTALAYFLRTLLLMPRLGRDQMDRGDFAADLPGNTTAGVVLPDGSTGGLTGLAGKLMKRIRTPGADLGSACDFIDARHAEGELTDAERDQLHEAIDYENSRPR